MPNNEPQTWVGLESCYKVINHVINHVIIHVTIVDDEDHGL